MNRPKLVLNLRKMDDLMMTMIILIQEQLETVKTALINQDKALAYQVKKMDKRIDDLEMEIERECIDAIALQQPLACDLRRIESTLKMITDLERIGDNSVNIARIVLSQKERFTIKPMIELQKLFELVMLMLRQWTDSYVRSSVELAVLTARIDDEVDLIYESFYRGMLEVLVDHPGKRDQIVAYLFIGRYLERMGDHVTNLSERVVYSVSGERVSF
ncbi:phosphate signaling complex protein PhoU [Acidaminobacter hydrogenoformans]|uniref:Phosphate-specific transport system accessory protein PhoU n=1 Tax=Acidaminobacter hydrogenoformans DSM 2784 TaxID=1120920 RepID=A0A1G5S717_9FIRM|nr:phosphate signaling complex protein PhoU [Acidaminobacter hydrogenoformans]SCZ82008.1 phosphate transport system protein [Acidaminobacter hydrogenoformans DSM 2784]